MPRPVEGLCLCLLLCSAAVFAEDPVPETTPDPDLLEFLGEWSTDDGGWLDPETLLKASELDDIDPAEATDKADGHDDAK